MRSLCEAAAGASSDELGAAESLPPPSPPPPGLCCGEAECGELMPARGGTVAPRPESGGKSARNPGPGLGFPSGGRTESSGDAGDGGEPGLAAALRGSPGPLLLPSLGKGLASRLMGSRPAGGCAASGAEAEDVSAVLAAWTAGPQPGRSLQARPRRQPSRRRSPRQ